MPYFEIGYYGLIVIVFFMLIGDLYLRLPLLWSTDSNKTLKPSPPVSVIICAQNEAANIGDLIDALIKQDYPDFEIIIVNDNSEDDTLEIVTHFKKNHQNIQLINIFNEKPFGAGKKYPLSLGIKAAKHELLLMTDADCLPASSNWIKSMAARYESSQMPIILGYGGYTKTSGLTNLLTRFETVQTALNYMGFAKKGKPYMGVGRNLLYSKAIWLKNNGFSSHMYVASGDDDLFIQEVANSKNTSYNIDPESFTFSKSETNISDWNTQKGRHISTSSHYKFKFQFQLAAQFCIKVLFYLLLPFSLYNQNLILSAAVFGSFILIRTIVLYKSNKVFKGSIPLILSPIISLILVSFQMFIFIKNQFVKTNNWS